MSLLQALHPLTKLFNLPPTSDEALRKDCSCRVGIFNRNLQDKALQLRHDN